MEAISSINLTTWQILKGLTLLKLPISTNRELDEAALWLEEWTFEVNQLLPPLFSENKIDVEPDFLVSHESIFLTAETLKEKQKQYRMQVKRRVNALVKIHHEVNNAFVEGATV